MQETSQRRRKVRELAATDVKPAAWVKTTPMSWARQGPARRSTSSATSSTRPGFLALLPPIACLRGLDVGCVRRRQHAAACRARREDVGRRHRTPPSRALRRRPAKPADPLGIDYAIGDAMQLPFDDGAFEFVTAFMSLMDMRGPRTRTAGDSPRTAARWLRAVLHPASVLRAAAPQGCCAIARARRARSRSATTSESTEGRVDCWWFSTLTRQGTPRGRAHSNADLPPHAEPVVRPLLAAAGLVVEKLGEPTAGTPARNATIP